MYATCLDCHAPLGANEMLVRFPVGRKLAFVPAKGRLWVVRRACRQWNVSPLDERCEAIEEGERLYRGTRLRASPDNVGHARLTDGTELIRIGEPQRQEFAARRYGARFTKRWMLDAPGAAVAGAAGVVAKGGGSGILFNIGIFLAVLILGLWATAGLVRRPKARSNGRWFDARDPELIVRGAEAARVAARLLPRVNRTGGRRATVAEAVALLDREGSAAAVFRRASRYDLDAKKVRRSRRFDEITSDGDRTPTHLSDFSRAPALVRLAVEMAAHEEQERQLVVGELDDPTTQWKEAEGIAAIADDLAPPAVLARLDRLRLR